MANRRSGKLWTPGLLKSRGWTKELMAQLFPRPQYRRFNGRSVPIGTGTMSGPQRPLRPFRPNPGGPCPGAPTYRPLRLRPKRQPPFWAGPGGTPPGRKPGLGCWPDIITRPLSPTSPLPPGAGGCGPIRFPAFSTNFSPWEPAAMRPSSPGCSPTSSKRVSGWGIIQTLPWPGWSRPSIPGFSGPPQNRSSAASPPPSRRPICRRCCR